MADANNTHLLLPTAYEGRKNTLTLQPGFFTSSLFVGPLRRDISGLLEAFLERVTAEVEKSVSTQPDSDVRDHVAGSPPSSQSQETSTPFKWFKEIWKAQKWDYLHLRVLESRGRRVFLETVMRLFMERMVPPEPVLNQMTAFFGLYTFYSTQPPNGVAYRQPYIHVPINVYRHLSTLPSLLPEGFDVYICYILHTLTSHHAFVLLPAAHLGPYDPSVLPQTYVGSVNPLSGRVKADVPDEVSGAEDANVYDGGPEDEGAGGTSSVEGTTNKPRCRTAMELQKRASRSVLALEKWANNAGDEASASTKRRKRRGAATVGGVDSEDMDESSIRALASKAKAEEEYFRFKEELLRLTALSPQRATIQDEAEGSRGDRMDIDFPHPTVRGRTQTSGVLHEILAEAESFAIQDIRELDALVRSRGIMIPVEGSLLEKVERQMRASTVGGDEKIGGLLSMVDRSGDNLGDIVGSSLRGSR